MISIINEGKKPDSNFAIGSLAALAIGGTIAAKLAKKAAIKKARDTNYNPHAGYDYNDYNRPMVQYDD